MWEPEKLTEKQKEYCLRTVSPNTFHMLCGDALLRGEGLSIVRVGEGELKLADCIEQDGKLTDWFPTEWLDRIGMLGISESEVWCRLMKAVNECDYFSPSISGIVNPIFDLYFLRDQAQYVDNFFINFWTEEQRINLYKAAGKATIIHRNPDTASALIFRAKEYLDVDVTYIHLSNWQQSEDVIDECSRLDAPLVLFSGGPGSKYIGPEIAKQGKVVLDVGNSMDFFLLYETWKNNKK